MQSSPPPASSKNATSSSSSQSHSSFDRTRRWPIPFSMSNSSSGSSTSRMGGEGDSSNNSIRQPNATYTLSRNTKPSEVRPGSASTVGSFSSARPTVSSPSSPYIGKANLPQSRSSTSSSNRTFHDPLTKEKEFETMLASGGTWKVSETADVAKGSSTRVQDNLEKHGFAYGMSEKRKPVAIIPEAMEINGEDDKEDLQRTPIFQARSFSAMSSSNPLRPPKSIDRSPSSNLSNLPISPSNFIAISNMGTSNSGSNKELPVHPHHRDDRDCSENKLNSQRYNSNQSPSPPAKSTSQMLGPSLQLRPPSSSISPSTSGQESMRSRASQQLQVHASPAFSNSSQATFTATQFKSDPIAPETQYLHLEGGPSNAALSEKSSSALKQRLKKTGGFLKRLGGGSSAEKSQLNPPRATKIVRKPSQSSIGSEGGISIANSTKSAPGEYQSRWGKETKVPVPSIPNRFKGSTARSGRGKENVNSLESQSGVSASSSAASQALSDARGRHHNKKPSTISDSAGSATTEMRHALQAWENEMDATLQQSGQDLESKTKIEKPSPFWTPSPQLPEYRLNRKASFMDEGDEARGETESLQLSNADTLKRGQISGSSYDSQFLVPFQQQRSVSLGMSLPSTVSPQVNIIHSDPLVSTPAFPSSPQREKSEDDGSNFRQRRGDKMSYASTRSYETAIDRPSFFVRHANCNEPSTAEKGVPEEAETSGEVNEEKEDEDADPEKSIRLITHESVDTDEGTVAGHKSDQADLKALAICEQAALGHAKDKTVMQSDIIPRTPSPTVEQIKESKAREEMAVDQSVDVAARELALKCWNEDETFKRKEKIAEWLGGTSLLQQLARKHYMDQFDYTGLRIDAAFRKLCDKLFLRAETQQVDRILSAFSQQYLDCNSQSVLVNSDVIHALVFSILLLNTDLHVADIQDRMTRNQFVRNTLAAILESSDVNSTQTWTNGGSIREEEVSSRSSLNVNADATVSDVPIVNPSSISSARPTPSRRVSNDVVSIAGSDALKGNTESIRTPFNKSWEAELEVLLKDIYVAIKTDQIRLPITDTSTLSSLAPRKPLRAGSDRVNALKRGSIRGIQGLLGGNASILRSEENLSASRSSLNSTQRSFSDYNATQSTPSSSLTGSVYGLPPTLGFANTLSQSIIKEAKDEDDSRSIDSANDDFTDDELAIMGPPWAKEGMLTRKHYWEAPLKRAKDKSWTDCFVVVQKGMFSMFRFGDSSTSSGNGINAAGSNVGIGGGNWLSNAICLGEYPLAHTLANSLPPPGYNRMRPHVFALTLPNGSVFFFQTGHEELVQEWVSTCNYWAARQSREPLAGGVSNMEYGWNRVLPSDERDDDDGASISQARPSIQQNNSDNRSIRSGKSGKSLRMRVTSNGIFQSRQSIGDRANTAGLSSPTPSSVRGYPSNFATPDRSVFINEWRAPAPPTVSSTLSEEDQLEACKRHKARVEAELTEHNTLRKPMMDYFASIPNMPTSSVSKAIANFDRKASYLLSDLTKFTLYTATLASANKLKMEKRDARQLHRMMLNADEESSKVKEEEEGPPLKA